MNIISIIIIIFALIHAAFYGWKTIHIFLPSVEREGRSMSWHIHQIWINFAGAGIGWICVYILYSTLPPFDTATSINKLTWTHLIISIIGVLGIMGFLPNTLQGISSSFKAFANLLEKKV